MSNRPLSTLLAPPDPGRELRQLAAAIVQDQAALLAEEAALVAVIRLGSPVGVRVLRAVDPVDEEEGEKS